MIYIMQCLCPKRHAIFAVAYDPETMPHDAVRAELQRKVEKLIAEKLIHPWCGICNSRDWRYEQTPTKWKSMEEAQSEGSKLGMLLAS